MTDCHVTLYIPGLLDMAGLYTALSAKDKPDCSSLCRALSRSRSSSHKDTVYESIVFELFGFSIEDETDIPVAALTVRLEENISRHQDYLMRVDPVYVQADRSQLLLLAHDELDVSQDEAESLTSTIVEHFEDEDWVLVAGSPTRWYIKSKTPFGIQTSPTSTVITKDIRPFLPRGQHGKKWCSILNEIQMLLHEHPVNVARETVAKIAINSVWFWGSGLLPNAVEKRWQGIWGDEIFIKALAGFTQTDFHTIPENAHEWMARTGSGQHLLVMDCFRSSLVRQDIFQWVECLHELETDWMIPLLSALKEKKLTSLTIHTEDKSFYLDRRLLRRWWRRTRAIESFFLAPD